jgi:hypothetical protein
MYFLNWQRTYPDEVVVPASPVPHRDTVKESEQAHKQILLTHWLMLELPIFTTMMEKVICVLPVKRKSNYQ